MNARHPFVSRSPIRMGHSNRDHPYLDTPAHRFRNGHDPLAGLPLQNCALLPAVLVDRADGPIGPSAFWDLGVQGICGPPPMGSGPRTQCRLGGVALAERARSPPQPFEQKDGRIEQGVRVGPTLTPELGPAPTERISAFDEHPGRTFSCPSPHFGS